MAGNITSAELNDSIATIIAAEALGYLQANTVLAQLVSRDWDDASEVYLTTGGSPFPQDLLNAADARKGEHGLSSYDATHRLAIAYVYEVPGFTSSNSMVNRVAYLSRGWQWSSTASFQWFA